MSGLKSVPKICSELTALLNKVPKERFILQQRILKKITLTHSILS